MRSPYGASALLRLVRVRVVRARIQVFVWVVMVVDQAATVRVDGRRWVPLRPPRMPMFGPGRGGGPVVGAVPDEWVVHIAAEGERVDIGRPAERPFGDVMDLAPRGRTRARWECAAPVAGHQDDPLISGRNSFGAPQVERSPVIVEYREVLMGM